jgi:hypothetical protein
MDPGSGSTPDPRDSGPIAQARAVIEHWEGSHERVDPLTEADVRAVLDEAADLMQLVDRSDRAERPPATGRSTSPSYTKEKLRPGGNSSARSQLCQGGTLSTCDPTEFLLEACLPVG